MDAIYKTLLFDGKISLTVYAAKAAENSIKRVRLRRGQRVRLQKPFWGSAIDGSDYSALMKIG